MHRNIKPQLICLTFCNWKLRTVLLVLRTLKHLVNVQDWSVLSVKSDRHIVIRSSIIEDRKIQKKRSSFFSQRHYSRHYSHLFFPSLKLEHVIPFSLHQDHVFRIDPSKVEDGKGKSPYDPRHNAASVLVGKIKTSRPLTFHLTCLAKFCFASFKF